MKLMSAATYPYTAMVNSCRWICPHCAAINTICRNALGRTFECDGCKTPVVVKFSKDISDPAAAIAAAREALERASKLVHLLTIRQVVEAGDSAINAAGLNPYAMNEGADPSATIGAHFISHALALLNGQQP